ncbi:FAD:protein FMN transferase [Planosporangium sp. 12N6]|uniref:FAD:protein FMN transferase n=1 Tax=Planosporangium spinosum TaxID=3402278 RepID=UPI003CF6EFBF
MTDGHGAADANRATRRAFVEQIMGLPVSVHVRGPRAGSPAAAAAVAAVFAELRLIDALFSPYRPDSLVSAVNRGEPVRDPLLDLVVDLCERARERTGGYFDAHLPAPAGGLVFDPSGLVKGWAVERAAAYLAELDRTELDWYVSAGGDLVVRGSWRVGVEDPAQPDRLVTALQVTDGAVATSGSAHRGAHVFDPHTGRPARGLRAVTVIGESLTWADVYATAALARGPEAVRWLAGVAGYEALLVRDDGTLLATPGWPLLDPRDD